MALRWKPWQAVACLSFCMGTVCTPPPLPGNFREKILWEEAPLPFSAHGKAVIATARERYQGSVDVVCNSGGTCNALWYGPLGMVVASMVADDTAGSVTLDKGTFFFRRDQTMDTLPFGWGGSLTFGDFIEIVSGRIPGVVSVVTGDPCDSVWYKKKAINQRWKTDNMVVTTVAHRATGAVEKVSATVTGTRPWTITLERFRRGTAQKIEIREDDRNYFSIQYEKVRNR